LRKPPWVLKSAGIVPASGLRAGMTALSLSLQAASIGEIPCVTQ
jgi:hypothetical protein